MEELYFDKYFNHFESIVTAHHKYIKLIISLILTLLFTISVTSYGLIYNQNKIIDSTKNEFITLNEHMAKQFSWMKQEYFQKVSQLISELIKYETSKEHGEMLNNIEAIRSEFQGIRRYITRLNNYVAENEKVDNDNMEKLIRISTRIDGIVSNIDLTPYQKIEQLKSSLENLEMIESNYGIYIFEENYERFIEDSARLKPELSLVYILLAPFFTLFIIFISLYKYHMNKIEKANLAKSNLIRLKIIINSSNDENLSFETLSQFILKESKSSSIEDKDFSGILSKAFKSFTKGEVQRENNLT